MQHEVISVNTLFRSGTHSISDWPGTWILFCLSAGNPSGNEIYIVSGKARDPSCKLLAEQVRSLEAPALRRSWLQRVENKGGESGN